MRVGKEEEKAPVSEAEEINKALVSKFFEEAWGKGNLAAVDTFMATDYMGASHPFWSAAWG
jgi:hypothetical protein